MKIITLGACFCECLQKKIKNISLEGLKMTICSNSKKDEMSEEFFFNFKTEEKTIFLFILNKKRSQPNISSLECHDENVEILYGVEFGNWDDCRSF